VLTTARQRRHGLATFETWVVWGIFAVSVCIWRAKPTLSSIQQFGFRCWSCQRLAHDGLHRTGWCLPPLMRSVPLYAETVASPALVGWWPLLFRSPCCGSPVLARARSLSESLVHHLLALGPQRLGAVWIERVGAKAAADVVAVGDFRHMAVVIVRNGLYLLDGSISVVDPLGVAVTANAPVRLCRCGQSQTKPFCDNSHIERGFTDDKNPRR
jgi:CDGSH-type Zn-finger protein